MTRVGAGPGQDPRRGQTEDTDPEKSQDPRGTRAQAQTSGSEERHGESLHVTREAHLRQTEGENPTGVKGESPSVMPDVTPIEVIGGNLMTDIEDNHTKTGEKKGENLLVIKERILQVKSSLKIGGSLLEAEGRERSQLEIEDNHMEAREKDPMELKGPDHLEEMEENIGGSLLMDKEKIPPRLSLKEEESLLGAEGRKGSP